MALPTFEHDRRIDIVDALNELSTAADAAIEAFETEAVTQAEGANAIQATIAPTESAGSKLTVSLKYGAGLAVQNGTLVATGGGEVAQKVVSLAANETLPLGNLTMQVTRNGIYFVTVSQQQAYDALLVNAVFTVISDLKGPGFHFQCADGNNATKWVVNSIEAPDLISGRFTVPVFGGYVQRDAQSYAQSPASCAASKTELNVSCLSSSRAAFYLAPLTVVRYH